MFIFIPHDNLFIDKSLFHIIFKTVFWLIWFYIFSRLNHVRVVVLQQRLLSRIQQYRRKNVGLNTLITQRLTIDLPFWENWWWTLCQARFPSSFVRFRTENVCTRCWTSSFTFSWTAGSKTVSRRLRSSWTDISFVLRLWQVQLDWYFCVCQCECFHDNISNCFLLSLIYYWLLILDLHRNGSETSNQFKYFLSSNPKMQAL